MNNAEKFKSLFGIYATELWAMPEEKFLEWLNAETERDGWVPVTERLPEFGKTVLITNDKGNVSYGRFRGVEFWKDEGDAFWTWKKNTIEHVIAWRPLPKPYKTEES